jgi:hypothetical protein
MSSVASAAVYSPNDLVWLREAMGGGLVELDPWGNVVVSPASDVHLVAVLRLVEILVVGLQGVDVSVAPEGPPWRVPGGSGYTNQPDVTVLAGSGIGRHPDHEWHLDPPPLLVVEVASPSTRTIDRTRKRADYLLGGAEQYLLVDLPGLAPVEEAALELWTAAGDSWSAAARGPTVDVTVGERLMSVKGAHLIATRA